HPSGRPPSQPPSGRPSRKPLRKPFRKPARSTLPEDPLRNLLSKTLSEILSKTPSGRATPKHPLSEAFGARRVSQNSFGAVAKPCRVPLRSLRRTPPSE